MSYRELTYIESTGSQYIDTGLAPNPHYSIEVSFMISQQTSKWDTVFGTRNGSYARFTARFTNSTTGLLGIHYSNASTAKYAEYTSSRKTFFTDDFHVLSLEKNVVSLDGELKKTFSSPADDVSFPYNLYLFANNDAGTAGDYAYIRMVYCKIWNDVELVRDFIPVLDENNVACLYDRVTETCFYNQGSGTFTAGDILPDEDPEPDDGPKYTELEYIQTIDNQYIDTGVIPTDHQIEIKFDCLAYDNDEHLFGTSSMSYYYHFTTYNNRYYWGYNGTEGNGGSWTTGPHVLVYNAVDNYRISLDDVILAEGTACVSPNVLWLFRRESAANFKGRLYYAKITDRSTGELVRDFIPVLDENNVACLYDRVTESYFYNQGSGLFATGRAVYKFDGKVREDDSWVDTISSKNMVVKKGSFVWQDDCLALTKNVNYFSFPTDYGTYGTFEVLVKIDESFVPVSTSKWYEASCIFGGELSGQQRDWAFVIDKNGYFAIGHGFSTITSTDVVANDGQWHTLTMVVGSSDITLYIDGEHKKTVTITMSGSQIATFGVGWNNATANTSITGHIGTIKVWDTVITEDEVVSSYADSLEWLGISTDKPTHGEAVFTIENVRHITSVADSSIRWDANTPEGTSVKVFTRLSDGEYAECVNGEVISGIEVGMDLTNSTLEIKVELATEDPEVTPSLTGLAVVIQNEGDDHVMVLILGTGNTTGIQNAIGEVNVAYAGGTLRGEGGMVPSFSMSFLPTNLAYEGHQNDVEHVDVDIEVTEDLVRVYHRDRNNPENISVSIEATTSLIYVDDI